MSGKRRAAAAAGVLVAAIAACGATPGPASATAAPVAACATSALRIALGQGEGAAGHFYVPVIFTNTGRACRISGYPDVAYFAGADHHQVGDAAGHEPGQTPVVVLRRGQSATSWVDQVNVDNYDPDECEPTPVTGLRVSPPGDSAAVLLPEPAARACARHMPEQRPLAVRPVTRGTP